MKGHLLQPRLGGAIRQTVRTVGGAAIPTLSLGYILPPRQALRINPDRPYA